MYGGCSSALSFFFVISEGLCASGFVFQFIFFLCVFLFVRFLEGLGCGELAKAPRRLT